MINNGSGSGGGSGSGSGSGGVFEKLLLLTTSSTILLC